MDPITAKHAAISRSPLNKRDFGLVDRPISNIYDTNFFRGLCAQRVESRVGGTKKRQQQDIDLAVDRWEEHKRRKARTS